MTSRHIELDPDSRPADGVISFRNGFPVVSFTISEQEGLLDPSTIRIVGEFNAYKDNLAVPTPLVNGDNVTMNNRLGIYNVLESMTIRSGRSNMICESIRHYSKFLNSYMACTSSLQDQLGHLGESCLIMPNATSFRKSVMEAPDVASKVDNSFSFHVPSGFIQSGNMINLRPDGFGAVILEFLLQPDSNVLFSTAGSSTGIGDAHYTLRNLKLTCEITDIPADKLTTDQSEGVYEFNTITSLYTSINSTNAQIQYSLALRNVLSAFMTFMPVTNINSLTGDGQSTTFPSGTAGVVTDLAPINRVQFLKGGTKFPAEFDYVNSIVGDANGKLPDPQIMRTFIEAIHPDSEFSMDRLSISPVNANRLYTLDASVTAETSYMSVAEGGPVYGLAVKYGIGGQGSDFSQEQFGVSIDSDLTEDNPIGVYLFIKSRSQLLFSPSGVQLRQ